MCTTTLKFRPRIKSKLTLLTESLRRNRFVFFSSNPECEEWLGLLLLSLLGSSAILTFRFLLVLLVLASMLLLLLLVLLLLVVNDAHGFFLFFCSDVCIIRKFGGKGRDREFLLVGLQLL